MQSYAPGHALTVMNRNINSSSNNYNKEMNPFPTATQYATARCSSLPQDSEELEPCLGRHQDQNPALQVTDINYGLLYPTSCSNHNNNTITANNANNHNNTTNTAPSATPSSDRSTSGGKPASAQRDCLNFWIFAAFLLALFALSVVLAFLFGHWLGDYDKERNDTNSSGHGGIDRETSPESLLHQVRGFYQPSVYDNFPGHRQKRPPTPTVRLSDHIIPMHYELFLNLTQFSAREIISGQMAVSLLVENLTRTLTLHATADVEITRLNLYKERTDGTLTVVETLPFRRNATLNIVVVRPKGPLTPGHYRLDSAFVSAICKDTLSGQHEYSGVHCYRSRDHVIDEEQPDHERNQTDSAPVVSLTTKFEPSLAKTLMPCFDDPKFKSTFNVTIIHDSRMTCLANTAVYRSRVDSDSWHVVKEFDETPPMPIYLLAFAIGPLINLEVFTKRGLPLTVWTLAEDLIKARFAANYSTYMFDMQEAEFQVLYPLSKMDFVASRSFPVGGMENWGVVVYHYGMLLIEDYDHYEGDPSTRLSDEYKIEKITAHEISHQWFGNLVTMKDWSGLWINEGFATFYVYEFVGRTRKWLTDYDRLLRMKELVEKQSGDEKVTLVKEHTTDDSVLETFDRLHLYTKGCVMVEMVRHLVGHQHFQPGINKFLKANAYGSVNRHHLWAAFPKLVKFGANSENLGAVMETWLVNPGVPEVHVQRNYNDHTLVITQRQADDNRHRSYLYTGGGGEQEKNKNNKHKDINNINKATWMIPLEYVFGPEFKFRRKFWLHNSTFELSDMDLVGAEVLLANPDWHFPYRVNYDRRNWEMLAERLNADHGSISVKSRVQLLADSTLFLSESSHIALHVAILRYLRKETDLRPLVAGVNYVYDLLNFHRASRAQTLLLIYLKPVIEQFDKVLSESVNDPEKLASWTMEPNSLNRLYMMRCAVMLPACTTNLLNTQVTVPTSKDFTVGSTASPGKRLSGTMAAPTAGFHHMTTTGALMQQIQGGAQTAMASDGGRNHQLVALCQSLYLAEEGAQELQLLLNELSKRSGTWSVMLQLAPCVRDERILDIAADQLAQATTMASTIVLSQELTLHYNYNFRLKLWRQLIRMPRENRSRKLNNRSHFTRLMLHSVMSLRELDMASRAITGLDLDKFYLSRRLGWIEGEAASLIEQHLVTRLKA